MSGDGIDFLLSGPVEPGALRLAVADALSIPDTSVLVHPDGRIEPVTVDPAALDVGEFRIVVTD